MATLDLPLSEEQVILRESIQRFLADHTRPGWRDLCDALCLGGLAAPEAAGGFGGGAIDIALAIAELGPALAGADWLSHAAATMLLGAAAPDHPALPALASGERRIATISAATAASMPVCDPAMVRGSATLVSGAAEAALLLLADPDALLLVAADHDKIEQRHRIMHDGSVSADLVFALKSDDMLLLASGDQAARSADFITDLILAARCAEAVGLMQRMIGDSVDYLGQRQQFGTAIGRFQVLRHRAADMQLAMMKAAALTEEAILAVDADRADRAAAVGAACIEVADAVRIVGESAVQIHGAMGLTEELSLGGHFKRALAIAAGLGPRAGHLARAVSAVA
jgi:alkylation response protein AidB-like acyl-CoA dehydrogenase